MLYHNGPLLGLDSNPTCGRSSLILEMLSNSPYSPFSEYGSISASSFNANGRAIFSGGGFWPVSLGFEKGFEAKQVSNR
jgi:hypothetical protein